MLVPPHITRHWLEIGALAAGGVSLAAGIAVIVAIRRRPTAEQREERRRHHLATHGRIVDGLLLEAEPADGEPRHVFYSYRIAGVRYECSQDVTCLAPLVQDLRLDYPVQVRYDRRNPADSIIIAETWNGMWSGLWQAGANPAGTTRPSSLAGHPSP